MKPLEEMTLQELDHFAAWAHAVEGTPGVEILTPEDPHDVQQYDSAHGHNTPEQMGGEE